MLLADFGADVIKVELAPGGDLSRNWGGERLGPKGDMSSVFVAGNRNKRSLALNLRQTGADEVVERLIRSADVVAHNFVPPTAEAIGIGYERVKALNPGAIYCAVSGFGQTGPLRDSPAQDQMMQAYTGISSITGEKGRPAVRVGPSAIDILAATQSAFGVVVALYDKLKNRSTEGQMVDTSIYEAGLSLMSAWIALYTGSGTVPGKSGPYFINNTPCGNFMAQDGREFHMAVVGETKWPSFCEMIELPELAHDPRFATLRDRVKHQDELYAILVEKFLEKPASTWVQLGKDRGITGSEIFDVSEVVRQPQAQEREGILTLPGLEGVKTAGVPVKLTETPGELRTSPPVMGQHSEEILSELGYSDEQIDELVRAGIAVIGLEPATN
jgi:crotonobetainyl-CoA:carnitine CoA-transferase CaiB-like acyl-CoA transferase